jgi:hypothetical protein
MPVELELVSKMQPISLDAQRRRLHARVGPKAGLWL